MLTRLTRPHRAALAWLGRTAESMARAAGGLAALVAGVTTALLMGRVSFRRFMDQAFDMGVQSIPLVMVTATLSGIVTSQQSGYQFTGAVPAYVLGSVVTSSVILELAPVMTAFVVIGRVGARITAELATMSVSEQIDALHSLGRDPVRVLAAPRILAGILAVPLLVAIADGVGVVAGMVAARSTTGLGPSAFLYGARLYWHSWDLFYSLLKGLTFGFWIPVIAVYMGLGARGGAEGVGRATNRAVVFMTVTVLVIDAMFPPLFLA